jgi:hypothetical protein
MVTTGIPYQTHEEVERGSKTQRMIVQKKKGSSRPLKKCYSHLEYRIFFLLDVE